MKSRLSQNFLTALFILAPIFTLSARGWEGGGAHRGDFIHSPYHNDGGYYGGGYYGGGYYGGGAVIYPYPDAESQPGMGDDSDALYQSYLKRDHRSY